MLRGVGQNGNASFNSVKTGTTTKTASYTATAADSTIRCDASTAAITVTLPAVSGARGQMLTIKKTDASANSVTIDPNGSEMVDGVLTLALSSQWQSVQIQSNGASWDVLSAN